MVITATLLILDSCCTGLLFGLLFGRWRAVSVLSPSKTAEGLLGQVLIGTSASIWFAAQVPQLGLTAESATVCGIILSVFAIGGDLWESTLKRMIGVKDMSNLFPGWGGGLDRFDGLLWTFPVWMILQNWFVSTLNPQPLVHLYLL